MKSKLVSTAACVLLLSAAAIAQSPPAEKNVNDWLLNAPGDADRFKLLQQYLRGFDQPMWEVGQRYESVYQALADKNFELAEYHWEKIKLTIEMGYLKRPKRQANSDAMFLKNVFEPMQAALKAKDEKKAWDNFGTVRLACMSCHEAEKVTFMNNQPMFRRTEQMPAR